MEIKPKIVIGLGNPGEEYEKTYHNAGFLFIQYLMDKKPANSEFRIQNSELLKSDAFMNESGKFVAKIIKKAGIKPAEVLIVHDDSDIELGKYKLSFGRGSAGHQGVESIIKSLGTKNFWRLRIGIRKKSKIKNQKSKMKIKAEKIVLKKITSADLKILNQVFEKITKQSN
ncbi:MAG: aminoacyl-tRNA hydrolase [Patescibacteria group bacterium]